MIKRIFLVAWKPNEVFPIIRDSDKRIIHFLLPFFLLLIAQLLAAYLTIGIIVQERMQDIAIDSAQFDETVTKSLNTALITSPVFLCGSILLISVFVLNTANFFSEKKLTFTDTVLIVANASIVDIWSYIIRIPLILYYESSKIYFSLAVFFQDESSFFVNFIKYLDVLLIWKFVVIGVGINVFTKNGQQKKYIILALAVLVIYGLLVALINSSIAQLKMYE